MLQKGEANWDASASSVNLLCERVFQRRHWQIIQNDRDATYNNPNQINEKTKDTATY